MMGSAKRQAKGTEAQKQELDAAEELYDSASGAFLLKYQINDKGIGHIYLPPSLSMLLQSDQIYNNALWRRSIYPVNRRLSFT
jgi:hypothetical protein